MELLAIQSTLWVSLALIVGLLMSKLMKVLHFPNVTGFLLTGILIGPWAIGFINQEVFTNAISNLTWISEIALGFIAFSIGGSFKFSALKKVGQKAMIITFFEALGAAVAVILGLFLAYFLGLKDQGLTIPMILIFGSIACATAPAATLLIIRQYKARGPVVETLVPVVAFDDAVALITFSILFSIASIMIGGGSFDAVTGLLLPIAEIIISIVLGLAVGLVISLLTRWFKSRTNRLILIIFGVLLCVGISQINTSSLGLSFDFQLSSLLTVMAVGGAYVNFAKGIDMTAEYLDKFTAPIFMLFFIISGATLNFSMFFGDGALLVLLIAITYVLSRVVGKWGGASLGAISTKCDKNVVKYLGFTLIPQAGVALGLASKANHMLGDNGGSLIYTIIIVSTIIYELTGPLITKTALIKAGEIK